MSPSVPSLDSGHEFYDPASVLEIQKLLTHVGCPLPAQEGDFLWGWSQEEPGQGILSLSEALSFLPLPCCP